MLSHFVYSTRKKGLLGLLCLLPAFSAFSQLSIGSSGPLFITNGTTFSADSLILIPSVNLTVTSNTIVKVATPINSTTPGVTSLARVYNIGAPLTYSGTLGLIYRDAELGSNTESLLQIAFNQTLNGVWTTTLGSTVNTVTNYVNNTVSAQPLANVTATTSGVILPITYSDFSAELNDQFVLISWSAESTTPLEGFTVESSADGRNWQSTAVIPAVREERAYSFKDADLNFSIRYYRIAIADISGKSIYTNVAIVRKPAAAISLQVISSGSDRVVNFPNATPDGIQLYDLNGRMLKNIEVPRSSYNLGPVATGIYILRFKVATEQNARKIFLP